MRTLLGLSLLVALSGCDGGGFDLDMATVSILGPSEGDTLHVSRGEYPAIDEQRLEWTATLPEDAGVHYMFYQFSDTPTFDQEETLDLGGHRRYEYARPTYSMFYPRSEIAPGTYPAEPIRRYWRVRVMDRDYQPGEWSEVRSFVVVHDLPGAEEN